MDRFGTSFWIEARAEYPAISKAALRVLIPFATSFMCEAGFSAVASKKTKCRSKLNIVSNNVPGLEALCRNERDNVSH